MQSAESSRSADTSWVICCTHQSWHSTACPSAQAAHTPVLVGLKRACQNCHSMKQHGWLRLAAFGSVCSLGLQMLWLCHLLSQHQLHRLVPALSNVRDLAGIVLKVKTYVKNLFSCPSRRCCCDVMLSSYFQYGELSCFRGASTYTLNHVNMLLLCNFL